MICDIDVFYMAEHAADPYCPHVDRCLCSKHCLLHKDIALIRSESSHGLTYYRVINRQRLAPESSRQRPERMLHTLQCQAVPAAKAFSCDEGEQSCFHETVIKQQKRLNTLSVLEHLHRSSFLKTLSRFSQIMLRRSRKKEEERRKTLMSQNRILQFSIYTHTCSLPCTRAQVQRLFLFQFTFCGKQSLELCSRQSWHEFFMFVVFFNYVTYIFEELIVNFLSKDIMFQYVLSLNIHNMIQYGKSSQKIMNFLMAFSAMRKIASWICKFLYLSPTNTKS